MVVASRHIKAEQRKTNQSIKQLETMTPFKQTKRRLTNLKKHFTELCEDGYINDLCEDLMHEQIDGIINHLKKMEIQQRIL